MALRIGYSMLSRRLGAAIAAASADAITIQLGAATKCSTSLLSSLRQQQQKFPAFSQASSCFSTLSNILSDEINYEVANYTKDPVVAAGPPAPFTLSEAPGDTEITLKRKFNNEEVVISATVNDQPDQPDLDEGDSSGQDEEEEDSSLVSFYVSINKGDDSLVFECTSDGTYLQVDHVSLEPKEGFDSKTMYTGPVFYELETGLKTQFQEFLAERGVDEQLGEYLRHVIYDKEQQEYTSWLKKVDSFLKK